MIYIIAYLIVALIAACWGWELAECGRATPRGVFAGVVSVLTWPVVVVASLGAMIRDALRAGAEG